LAQARGRGLSGAGAPGPLPQGRGAGDDSVRRPRATRRGRPRRRPAGAAGRCRVRLARRLPGSDPPGGGNLMASVDELARSHTTLEGPALAHVQRLVTQWGLLADFCFADLLLFAPVAGGDDSRFVILGQIRPTTSQTLYREDQVGRIVDETERPLVARAWRLGQIIDGEISSSSRGERARVQCIPVRRRETLLGILARES